MAGRKKTRSKKKTSSLRKKVKKRVKKVKNSAKKAVRKAKKPAKRVVRKAGRVAKKAVKEAVKAVTSARGHKLRCAINGFGRIGRMVFKVALANKQLEIVAINDLTPVSTLAHLLKYDSVHGRFDGEISTTKKGLVINGKEIPLHAEKDPEKLPWGKHRIDLVFECTGRFLTRQLARKHLKAGARKVLLSAPHKCPPSEDQIKTVVLGVNDETLKKSDVIVSNASCTTNCFAPLVKVLDDSFGVRNGYMITVHAATATQHLVDGPDKKLRRARSALNNIIPTSTGAAKAIGKVIPKMDGKIAASSVRVPLADGSICYFVAEVNKKVDKSLVNAAFKKAAGKIPSVLYYCNEPIVSSDIIDDSHSAIFDSLLTAVEGNHLVTVAAWYDNEWGYSCRMIDVALLMFQ